ncbi:AraC family ligand binding domain-containing protein [Paenibacillus polymyxa]|uniref:AraC family ligand binding domain-containing protein n=1 Tax=Paenibacillus polymyxa TaxID=1406 RepID=UPI0037CA5321
MGFLFGKQTTQQYRTIPEDPWDVRWIHFDGQDVDSLLQGRSMTNRICSRYIGQNV